MIMAVSGASSRQRSILAAMWALWCLLLLQSQWQSHVQAAGGPCSSKMVSIPVRQPADIQLRLRYPWNQSVRLVLYNNLAVRSSLALVGTGFSCTVLTSAGRKAKAIGYAGNRGGAFPLVLVANASNVMLTRVSLSVGASPAQCDRRQLGQDVGPGKATPCPAIFAHRSWGVTVSHCSVAGRLDLFGVTQGRIESSLVAIGEGDIGVRIASCGDGPNLISSEVFVSNNKVSGGVQGVLISGGAVGVTVNNNDFHNHIFTAIQCGSGYTNVGDCMLSNIHHNFISTDPGFTPLTDASGIYFATHWVNPGNVLTCNYVLGGRHCIYLDYSSSGVTVDGAVCANTFDGVKLNAGHNNIVTGVVAINNTGLAGWMSGQNYDVNNCLRAPGSVWESKRAASYSSPAFRRKFPWLTDFCSRTSLGGVPCNPKASGAAPASRTGGCSGMPTGNVMKLSIVDAWRYPPWNQPAYQHCLPDLPAVPKLNQLAYQYYWTQPSSTGAKQVQPPWDNVAFNNYQAGDYGLQPGSVIRRQYAGLRSCPRADVGAKPIPPPKAFSFFNVPRS